MKLNLIITSILTFFIVFTQAQQRSCATMDVYQSQIENNSNFLIKQQNLEQMTEYYNNMLPLMNNSEEVYTIPVVIHVLYKTSSENISDEQVYSQMTSLNDDFRALNNDLSSLPSNFEPLVSDMQIEFCLAQVDPNGNSTSGINRVSTNQNSFSYNNNMKFSSSGGVDAWDTDSYLNIWVCSLNNLLGYAQFPGGDASTDGVVVANTAFGSTGIAQAPYDLGRTLTHEIGHWLNLRHIWGDSNCGNDLVDDTPTHQEANYGCPNYPQESCNNGPDGDLFMNYMDYTNDACMYMFTTGQRTRMTSALLNSRSSLLNSTACSIGAIVGCTDPNAANYNPDATQDDNSCEYPCLANEVTLNILSDCYPEETSWELFDQDGILLESSSDYSDLSQTQIIESFCLEDGCYTLKMMDSYGDGLNGSIWSCNTDGDYSMTDADNNILFEMQEVDFGNSITHEFCFSSAPIFGCTDATADNFNPEATQEDLSCTYCDNFSSVLISSNDATSDNPSGGSIQATGQGGSSNYSLTVYDNDGNIQNPFELQEGTYNAIVSDNEFGCSETISVAIGLIIIQDEACDIVPTGLYVDNIIHNRIVFNWSTPSSLPSHYMIRYRATGTNNWTVITAGSINDNQYNGTSRTRYFMEPLTSYQWSIRARVLNEDGSTSCQSSWSPNSNYTTLPLCANLENLSTSSEANWVTLMADAPSPNWGVWQSKGKMREVGTNSYRYVNGSANGINFLKGNFDANTEYEWQTKAWCTGNVDSNDNSDPMYHSGWGEFSGFTTEANCSASPTNLSTISGNGANTALTMSWNSPQSGNPDHYFLELTNESTGQIWAWNNIAGNSNSKTKYGLTNGHNYSWRIRGACGTNGTSWATSFTASAYYTLGGQRMASPITNLEVYPNPSKGMFSINFESKESQNIEISITNYLGEKVFKQEVSNLINTYNRTIDLSNKANGIYLLSVKTNNKIFNKKIVIQ
jgi:hypothetical protein